MDDFPTVNWFKVGLWSFLTIFVFFPIIGIMAAAQGYVLLPFFKFAAKVKNTQDTINIVYDAQRCIGVNKLYQDLRADVPALRDIQIPNAKKALADFEAKQPTDRTQWSRTAEEQDGVLQTNVTGLEQQLASLQANYQSLTNRDDTEPCLGHLPTFIDLK